MVCRKILCDKCLAASSRHDQHRKDLLPIQEAVSKIRDSLIAKVTASFSGEESQLKDALAATDKALSQLHDQTEAVSSQVNDFFTQLKKVIDRREHQLLGELDQLQLPQYLQLQERKQRSLSSLSTRQRVKHLTEYCQSDSNFLKMCGWLEDATHDVMDATEAEVKPFQPVTLQFTADCKDESYTAISKAGSVWIADTVSSEKSTAAIPANVDEGQDLRISIDLRNQRGDALTATDQHLNSVKVEVTTGENDVTICPVLKATDAETSSSPVFAVFKTGSVKKGQVKVCVTTDTGHIRGSPAVSIVADVLRFDRDRCHAGLVLSSNGRTVTHAAARWSNRVVYGTTRWSTGKHEISVCLDTFGPAPYSAYNNYSLGMCNEKEPLLTGFYPNLAWTSYSSTSHGYLGQPWKPGDVIHMSLDCDNHTLVACHERTGAVDTKTNVTGEIRLYLLTTSPQDQATIL
ncbi:uncharacterized protein LOC135820022 [Sycon ciliatum]|uniref:uncharacterized protein LOC135820022 n=1 Tax=Sycon ciliatum TaxID=27933 RepID=UPI0031F6A0B7